MKLLENTLRTGLAVVIAVAFMYGDLLQAQPTPNAISPSQIAVAATAAPDTISGKQQEMLVDLLNSSLQSLARQDRNGRMIGGYVMLGLGAGSAVGGAVTLAVGKGDDADIVGYSLLGGGALLSGLSLIPFKLKTEVERLYADFSSDMGRAPGQNTQKYYYWDRRFQELAEKSRQGRIIGGITSIVAGGVSSLLFVDDPTGRVNTFLWPAIGGVTSLIVKSEVERRYESYRQAKQDMVGQSASARIGISVGIYPLASGGIVGRLKANF